MCASLLEESQILLFTGLERIPRLIPSILEGIFNTIQHSFSDLFKGHSVVLLSGFVFLVNSFIWEVFVETNLNPFLVLINYSVCLVLFIILDVVQDT